MRRELPPALLRTIGLVLLAVSALVAVAIARNLGESPTSGQGSSALGSDGADLAGGAESFAPPSINPGLVDQSGLSPELTPTSPDTTSTDRPSQSVPSSAVVVGVGESVQGWVDRFPVGTVFFLPAGVYRRQTVIPKDGNVFVGGDGAVFDGEGVAGYAFEGGADDVTIRNLVIENYANDVRTGVVRSTAGARRWTVEGNVFRFNRGAGVFASTGWRVIGNTVHHNGQAGVFAWGADIVIEGNEIAYNNTDRHDPYWEAGGTKFVKTQNLVVRDNHVHHNHGPGLWTDGSNIDTLYEGNLVTDNFGPGILHEISYDAVIRNNTVERNGSGFTQWMDGSGIIVHSSPNVEVYGNTVRDNRHGIGGVQTDRGSGDYGLYQLRNFRVHDNLIVMPSGTTGIVTNLSGTGVFDSWSNQFDHNTYQLGANTRPYQWGGGQPKTVDQWRALGQDPNSTWR